MQTVEKCFTSWNDENLVSSLTSAFRTDMPFRVWFSYHVLGITDLAGTEELPALPLHTTICQQKTAWMDYCCWFLLSSLFTMRIAKLNFQWDKYECNICTQVSQPYAHFFTIVKILNAVVIKLSGSVFNYIVRATFKWNVGELLFATLRVCTAVTNRVAYFFGGSHQHSH